MTKSFCNSHATIQVYNSCFAPQSSSSTATVHKSGSIAKKREIKKNQKIKCKHVIRETLAIDY